MTGRDHARFAELMQAFTDEARDGPRLFSLVPIDPGFFSKLRWISEKFRLTLWCEHARIPLPELNEEGDNSGVHDLDLPREWVTKAAPFLRMLTTTLSLVLPVAASATNLVMEEAAYKAISKELLLSQKCIDSVLKGWQKVGGRMTRGDAPDWEHGEGIRAQGGMLRELHTLLRERDPGFGGLVRVQNKRREFLWVHPRFVDEY